MPDLSEVKLYFFNSVSKLIYVLQCIVCLWCMLEDRLRLRLRLRLRAENDNEVEEGGIKSSFLISTPEGCI